LAPPPQPADVAETLVNQCANIRPNELVLIKGGMRDQQLLEEVAVKVRQLGAHPLITIGSDQLERRLVVDVPTQFDKQEPAFQMRLAEIVDAVISVDFAETPDLFADVDAKRLARIAKGSEDVYQQMLDRNVLHVHLGNGLYPTKALAKQFDIPVDKLAGIFWSGVNTDYRTLQTTGAKVKRMLVDGRMVHITAPNGTDLKFEIGKRPVFVSDGVISSDDRYAGGPACQVWLPAGEVYVTPVPKTAEGTFVVDDFFFEGRHIEGLTFQFKRGKMTRMTAKDDIKALEKHFDAAPKGRDLLAALDIGINPDVMVPQDSRMVTWMAEGTISVGIGGNTWAGGDNDVPFMLFGHLTNGMLSIDDQPLIERGKLMVR
jgi:leucyl aminopeptidase (aminopeptidase T)